MIVVTGTKRSGTSMWMHLLVAAGLPFIGDRFAEGWGALLRSANPDGFFESELMAGVYFRTNPHPLTGAYLAPEQTRDHAVKIFVAGLIRTDVAFRCIAIVRSWREYVVSTRRVLAMQTGVRADAGGLPPALEGWCSNYALIRDLAIRGYPMHVVSYDSLLRDPQRVAAEALEWIGHGDPVAAAAVVRRRAEPRAASPKPNPNPEALTGPTVATPARSSTAAAPVAHRRDAEGCRPGHVRCGLGGRGWLPGGARAQGGSNPARVGAVQRDTFTLLQAKTGAILVLPKSGVTSMRVRVAPPLPGQNGTGWLVGGGLLTATGSPVFVAGLSILGLCPSCASLHIPLLLVGGAALGTGIPMLVRGSRLRRNYQNVIQERGLSPVANAHAAWVDRRAQVSVLARRTAYQLCGYDSAPAAAPGVAPHWWCARHGLASRLDRRAAVAHTWYAVRPL